MGESYEFIGEGAGGGGESNPTIGSTLARE